ncbi:class I SAM-dependent methyltransferase (plasmid) [Mesorhizobium sp. AR10]|uniref:class I SAM-dependent methyltransferase n=1 Tax=Mesorhizobium sp. AR10 TaxID=2865839 RepID=UPI002160CB12|nr:class I SAM-dependent methyltransferase [Mesorhizobium sp. AR10]UVK35995.1 class I SAM-dependent methyltransferase [Mesorhizobium sp. AR10]
MIVATELFRGAAPYYAKHTIPYPDDLFRSLVRICRPAEHSRALDLGAGTGQIGIPLARSVGEVICVDPSEEMVEEGRRAADVQGIDNVGFFVSRSEDLDELSRLFDIATIAGSFHWMDRGAVLAKLAGMVKPDGCVAIFDRDRDRSEPGEWSKAMWSDIKEFWGGSFPAGPGATRPLLTMTNREVLSASPFSEITELRHYYEHHWSLDDLIGYLYSTSKGASGTLGARREEFTIRIRQLLLSYSPSGFFSEQGHVTTLIGFRP